jgi:hypothetical protein
MTRPIPIEVHHGAFTALLKLTLQAGLAQSIVPGTLGHFHPNQDVRAAPDDFRPPPTGALSPMRVEAPVTTRSKGRWRERKKAGLTVRVDGYVKVTSPTPTPMDKALGEKVKG